MQAMVISTKHIRLEDVLEATNAAGMSTKKCVCTGKDNLQRTEYKHLVLQLY